jgi:hypothetical protein
MPTAGTPRSSYRLGPSTVAKIAEIAEAQHGLSKARVIEWAVEQLHREVCDPARTMPSKPGK